LNRLAVQRNAIPAGTVKYRNIQHGIMLFIEYNYSEERKER